MALKLDHLTILVSDWAAYERHYSTLLPLIGFSRVDETIWTDGEGFFLQFGQARLARVQAAIRDGVSAILAIRTRVERLRDSGAEIVRMAPEVPNSAAAVGISAVVCASAAAGAVANASASISVSVEVSVSMSASVSGSASAR